MSREDIVTVKAKDGRAVAFAMGQRFGAQAGRWRSG